MSRQHGTRAKYVFERCRCDDCRDANTTEQQRYARRKAMEAHGALTLFVDAEPVRTHVRALMDAGMGTKQVAKTAGVSTGTLGRLLYGKPSQGAPPSSRIRPHVADALMGLRAPVVAEGNPVDSTGTRRRLQALMAIGWSGAELMRRLGKQPTDFGTTNARSRVLPATVRAVRDLYDELWDTTPATDNHRQRISVARARNYAAAREWAPPQAWDDDTIDDPAAMPAQRWSGGGGVDLDEVAHLAAGGCSVDEIARRIGVTVGAIERAQLRARAS